ncbi:MAG: SMP-30/gluconolactonase/LRE family protein [Variovorax sp.]
MSNYDIVHARFRSLVLGSAAPELLFDGGRWLEGPLWLADSEQLLFSDIPNDRVMRWVPGLGAAPMRTTAVGAFENGRTRDLEGRVIACEHGGRRLVRTELDGSRTVLCNSHGGRRLNSPNDVVVKRDGSVWFTDPDYGILTDYEGFRAPREQAACHVFRLAPGASEPETVVSDMVKPNGLAFSPDESLLYVADSGGSHAADRKPHHIRRFEVHIDGTLSDAGVLAEVAPGLPDGIAVDEHGHVWTSAGDGVHCLDADGNLLGRIRLPQPVSNLCFGGPARNRLFITATSALYAIYVGVRSA